MLGRIPVDGQGQFPVNAHLVSALATGFLLFNQVLFWLVAVLLVREGKAVPALRFVWMSGGTALAVWLSLAWMLWRERTLRAVEMAAMAAGLAGLGWACHRKPPSAGEAAVVSALLAAWVFRGALRRLFGAGRGSAKKSPNP